LVWRAYYLIKKDNYLKISTLLIGVFSAFAIILNNEGINCITQINSSPLISSSSNGVGEVDSNSDFMNQQEEENQQQQQQQQQAEQQQQQQAEQQQQQQDAAEDTQSQETLMQQYYELRKYCFLVTNLYVYSLFGVAIGFILLVLWFMRYKKNWAGKENGLTR
jgi:preprotein translocase subunit SecF